MSLIVLKTFDASPRMAVRVVTFPRHQGVFQVQYEVAPAKWRTWQRPDRSFFFHDRDLAIAAARRCHRRNN